MTHKTIIMAPVVGEWPTCPRCHARFGAISGDAMPKRGDWNLCASCFGLLRFTGEGFLCEPATLEELEVEAALGHIAEKDANVLRMAATMRGPKA